MEFFCSVPWYVPPLTTILSHTPHFVELENLTAYHHCLKNLIKGVYGRHWQARGADYNLVIEASVV